MTDVKAEELAGQNPQQAEDNRWSQTVSQSYFYIEKQLDGDQIKNNQYQRR